MITVLVVVRLMVDDIYKLKIAMIPFRGFPTRMVYLYYIYIMLEIHHSGRELSILKMTLRVRAVDVAMVVLLKTVMMMMM